MNQLEVRGAVVFPVEITILVAGDMQTYSFSDVISEHMLYAVLSYKNTTDQNVDLTCVAFPPRTDDAVLNYLGRKLPYFKQSDDENFPVAPFYVLPLGDVDEAKESRERVLKDVRNVFAAV